jgi:hypothetical protein
MSENRVIVEAVLAGRSHATVAERCWVWKVSVGKLIAVSTAKCSEATANQSLSANRRKHGNWTPGSVNTFDEYLVSESLTVEWGHARA